MQEPVVEPNEDRVGVLILRVWTEGPLPEGLRVRMTSRLDLLSDNDAVVLATDTAAVISAVRKWLDNFLSDGSGSLD